MSPEKSFPWQVHRTRTKNDVGMILGVMLEYTRGYREDSSRRRSRNRSSSRSVHRQCSIFEGVDEPFGAEPEAVEGRGDEVG